MGSVLGSYLRVRPEKERTLKNETLCVPSNNKKNNNSGNLKYLINQEVCSKMCDF